MARVVVIGGVAAGMSAASQAKRRRPGWEVVVLERGRDVSYGACGMPYNIMDAERSIDDLVVLSRDKLRGERGIDVRTRHDAVAIESETRFVLARDLESGVEYPLSYDALVIATGAAAVRPPIPGMDTRGIFVMRELSDGAALKHHLDDARPRLAVIIGAGYIGMEMAEALRARGLEVAIVEKQRQVLPGFDPLIAEAVSAELSRQGIGVELGVSVRAIEEGDKCCLRVRTDGAALLADVVLVAVGVRPQVDLASRAGIALGATGAIAVDARMETNVPGVFAAGDCAEAHHLVLGEPAYMPLGTTANKQGKVAGANAAGADERFSGIVGTAGFKVFDLEVGRTGLSPADAERRGALRVASSHASRGHAYPGGAKLQTVLSVEPDTRRLLGAQMVGAGTVATRIDVYATALHAGMTVDEIADLDLVYAPPFAPVYDPILIAATVARKAMAKVVA